MQPNSRTIWRFKKKMKNRVVQLYQKQSSNINPGHISGQNSNLKRCMHPYVHSRAIYNSPDIETSWTPINGWMGKEEAVCVCSVAQSCLTLLQPIDYRPPDPLSMGFPKQEYWSGMPFPSPGDLPKPGIESAPLASPALVGRFFSISTTRESQRRSST